MSYRLVNGGLALFVRDFQLIGCFIHVLIMASTIVFFTIAIVAGLNTDKL